MRTLMRTKTLKAIWGSFDEGEPKIEVADLHPKIPSREGQILLDETMEMRLNGVRTVYRLFKKDAPDFFADLILQGWQGRRIVCTESKLYFALSGEDLVRDQIPLEEITSVDIMRESKDLEDLLATFGGDRPRASIVSNKNSRRSSAIKQRRASLIAVFSAPPHESEENPTHLSTFFKAFQIHTIPDGFNSGRTYYLQAQSTQACQDVVVQLQEYAAAARARGEKVSRVTRAQAAFRAVHDSAPFQLLSALVIVTVLPPPPTPPPPVPRAPLSAGCPALQSRSAQHARG